MQTKNNSQTWNFQNSYIELPTKLYSKQLPTPISKPEIFYFNDSLAKDLGLENLLVVTTLVFLSNLIPSPSRILTILSKKETCISAFSLPLIENSTTEHLECRGSIILFL